MQEPGRLQRTVRETWNLTSAYWRIGNGFVGSLYLIGLTIAAIIASPVILLLLVVRLIYAALPHPIRASVSRWREARSRLISLSSYAFVRYKQRRNAGASANMASLLTTAIPGLVSIILPVYNGADLLRESLDSILTQTYQQFEVIAINDGSTDGSGDLLEEYARNDARIRVFHQENRKIPRTLSRGARIAEGEYLTWTSCDNRMKPDFLQQLVGSLRRHPDWDMVYANKDIIGEDGEPLRNSGWYSGFQHPPKSEHIYLPADVTELNTHPGNFIGAAFMYRSRAAWLIGDYSSIRFTVEDYDYWMRMNSLLTLRHADFDTPIYEYRFHEASLTATVKELDILASLDKLMAFEDFRRDFQVSPLIWVIECDNGAGSKKLATLLRTYTRNRGHMLLTAEELATYHLPRLWMPVVYVRVAERVTESLLQPATSLPANTLRVLLAAQEPANDAEHAPHETWDMCVAYTKSSKLRRIAEGYVGWFGCADTPTIFTAIDIRARSYHELAIEQEIAGSQTMPQRLKASIVICARRSEQALAAVQSAANQTMPQDEYEVIVVNSGARDATLANRLEEARQSWFPAHPQCLRYVDCPIAGLPSARNAGISEAAGEIVAFLDEDALASPSWLERTWSVFAAHPETGVLGGRVELRAVEPRPAALQPGIESYWGQDLPAQSLLDVDDWRAYPVGGNWSARHRALLEIGGFRTRYCGVVGDLTGGEKLIATGLIRSLGYHVAVDRDSTVTQTPDVSSFTWRHVEQAIRAEALSDYMLGLDTYLPAATPMSETIKRAIRPHVDPALSQGRVGRRLRKYQRRAYWRVAREQWKHRAARRTPGLIAIDRTAQSA